jgi:threonine dehydratase
VAVIDNGDLCGHIIDLYQNEGIVCEPAGALSVAGLGKFHDELKNKKVVCIVSGGNNDITRYAEILERALIYKELKKYLIINFAQKPGELKNFLNNILGPSDDIVRFEYMKKNNKESGPALVGLEFKNKNNFKVLLEKLRMGEVNFIDITEDPILFQYLV